MKKSSLLLHLAHLLLMLPMFSLQYVHGQPTSQTIKGQVVDAQSQYPLVGAAVMLVGSDPIVGTVTDAEGNFKLNQVPLGRQTIKLSFVGYKEQVLPNVLVTSGKEVMLRIALEEQIYTSEAVVIRADRDKSATNNEFTTVSARSFNPEETTRFAGSRNDPARMAANFAGVSGANDARNDIIIRGNSPTGVLWRLDGINIPNPSHYGAVGASGGPVSLLNYNVLDKSDFMTAAFPAQYGNALAGVFDLQMRTGNNEKREYLGQIGFNGFELGAEGPFKKDSRASYLVNYRYSTLGLFQAVGLDFGTGSATPQYQDVNFKIHVPTAKAGVFSVFGIGGTSRVNFLGSEADTTESNLYGDENQDVRVQFRTGVLGISHLYYFNPTFYSKISLAASTAWQQANIDSLSIENRSIVDLEEADYGQNKYSLHWQLNKKFSARDNVQGGVILDLYQFDLLNSRLTPTGGFRPIRNTNGESLLSQAYAQWQHRFSERFTMNAGLNLQHFSLSNNAALEPRLGLRYGLTDRQFLGVAYGLHHQIQPLLVYATETPTPNGASIRTNEELDFTRSQHWALTYEHALGANLHLKLETYYQQISNAPVERQPSSFSLLNAGADFGFPDNDNLVSEGTGRNYGVELTLEKYYSQGYYFLLTGSLFDSKYTGSDGVLRNTAFNGQYVLNLLAGKEFKMGRRNNTFNIDWKVTTAGGNYRTPINFEQSQLVGEAVYDENRAFSARINDYFRTDLKLSYRLNRPRVTHEFALDLQNLTGNQNVFMQRYNARTNALVTEYQIGFFPIPQYRILF